MIITHTCVKSITNNSVFNLTVFLGNNIAFLKEMNNININEKSGFHMIFLIV